MNWTDQRVERLRELMAEGKLSCSQVADELGGITRNAVVGKCHRMKIPITAHAPRGGESRMKKRLAAREAKRQVVHKLPPPSIAAVLSPLLPEQPRPDGTVTIMGLTNETCRWPMMDVPPQVYCGRTEADVAAGYPYCTEHSIQATGVSNPRRVQYFNKGAA